MTHISGGLGPRGSRDFTCSWIMSGQQETSSFSTEEVADMSREEASNADTSSTVMFPECGKVPYAQTDRVKFNIRGIKYDVERECLHRAPMTSKLRILPPEHLDLDTGEYYFNRDPYIFNSFLNYLVNGDMHFQRCVCVDELEREMAYWGLDDYLLQHCCWERAESEKNRRQTMKLVEQEWFGMVLDFENKKSCEVPFRDKLWLFLEEPASSVGAQLWSLFVLTLVFTSNIILGLETVPMFRKFSNPEAEYNYTMGIIKEGRVLYRLYHSNPYMAIVVLDITCFSMMTFELLFRFIVTRKKFKFCRAVLNIIDFLALLPMWINLTMFGVRQTTSESESATTAFYVVGGLRLLRTFRAIRIMKSYKPMKILLLAWKASYKEMLLLIILTTVVAVVFANLLFFSELSSDEVSSIPAATWWALITMTTVGYGDIVPQTIIGRVIGAACAISGIVVVAMPVPVIVSNFSFYYDCLKSILQARKLRKCRNISAYRDQEDLLIYSQKHFTETIGVTSDLP